MAVKVTIDIGNGEPTTYECDGAVCACIEHGKGPTGLEVTVVDGGHLSYSEKVPCDCGDAELQDDIGRESTIFYRAVCADVECKGHYCNNWSMTQQRAISAWNTRAERTCKNVEYDSASKFECSECGFSVATVPDGPSDWLTFAWSYCPSCGAKVVE